MRSPEESHLLLETKLALRPSKTGSLPPGEGQRLMAAFLDLVRDADPALATYLHDSKGVKPFTVSLLLGGGPSEGAENPHLHTEKDYTLRVTTFDARLSEVWKEEVLPDIEGKVLRLGYELFEVTEYSLEEEPLARIYRRHIIEGNKSPAVFRLRFHTPTAFRSGQSNFLFPLPRFVWLSLNRSWSSVARVDLGRDLHLWAEKEILVARYELKTNILHFDRYRQVGFTGTCEYRVVSSGGERLRSYRLLADFSRYCGVGIKTTMGMGQTTPLM